MPALFLFCGSCPARAQATDVDTPVERTTPVTPVEPVTPAEPTEPAQPREVLVKTQPEGPKKREKSRLRIGPELELFMPSSAKTRDRFGNNWFGLGVGFGSVHQEGLLGTWSAEFYLMQNSHHGNKAYVAPLGVAYRRALVDRQGTRPYVGASVDLILADFVSRTDGIPWGLRAGGGGSVLAGATFGKKGFVEARYLATSSIKGLNFSGLDLTGGVRF
jgi:hypothetical protein